MSEFGQLLDRAGTAATCNALGALGSSLVSYGAYSLVASGTGIIPIGLGAATLLAKEFACGWDPDAPGLPPGSAGSSCSKINGASQLRGRKSDGTTEWLGYAHAWSEILTLTHRPDEDHDIYEIKGIIANGSENTTFSSFLDKPLFWTDFYLTPSDGQCLGPGIPGGNPVVPEYNYTDATTGCTLNVQFLGLGIDGQGVARPVFQMEQAAATQRASGPLGTCDFAPVIYMGPGGGSGDGGGGGGDYFPVPSPIPPDGDEPWWTELVRGALWGVGNAATQALINEIFATKYGGGSYELKGVCELDPDGNPMDVTRSINFPEATSPDAMLYRLDALADMFQFAKDLRQPTCRESGQPITGDPVTINFISDDVSPESLRQLRKRFVYFDQVNSTLEATVNHWRDFTWQAGPLIVNCFDTKLGKPQVWAASLAEAQRVFAHAAAIAGVDLTGARYETATPKNSRYGVSGLMRVHKDNNGTLGITKRDGPSGFPEGLG